MRVRALTRNPTEATLAAAAEIVAVDLSDPTRCRAAFDGVDGIFVLPTGGVTDLVDAALAGGNPDSWCCRP